MEPTQEKQVWAGLPESITQSLEQILALHDKAKGELLRLIDGANKELLTWRDIEEKGRKVSLAKGGFPRISLNCAGKAVDFFPDSVLKANVPNFFQALISTQIWNSESRFKYFLDRNARFVEPVLKLIRTGSVSFSSFRSPLDLPFVMDEIKFFLIEADSDPQKQIITLRHPVFPERPKPVEELLTPLQITDGTSIKFPKDLTVPQGEEQYWISLAEAMRQTEQASLSMAKCTFDAKNNLDKWKQLEEKLKKLAKEAENPVVFSFGGEEVWMPQSVFDRFPTFKQQLETNDSMWRKDLDNKTFLCLERPVFLETIVHYLRTSSDGYDGHGTLCYHFVDDWAAKFDLLIQELIAFGIPIPPVIDPRPTRRTPDVSTVPTQRHARRTQGTGWNCSAIGLVPVRKAKFRGDPTNASTDFFVGLVPEDKYQHNAPNTTFGYWFYWHTAALRKGGADIVQATNLKVDSSVEFELDAETKSVKVLVDGELIANNPWVNIADFDTKFYPCILFNVANVTVELEAIVPL